MSNVHGIQVGFAIVALAMAARLVACSELGELEERFEAEEHRGRVTILDPEETAGGYTLLQFERRLPYLIDIEGRVVHSWPNVRSWSRARLSREGKLLVLTKETPSRIREYDWEGRLLFDYLLRDGRAHHDVVELRNGNFLVIAGFYGEPDPENSPRGDRLVEVNREGVIVWRWNSYEHAEALEAWDSGERDPSHLNSVHELHDNSLHAAGDARFRPGNLLVSARKLNTVFIIDRRSGEIVWKHSQGLDNQHEAMMLDESHALSGQILLFNNGLDGREAYRSTRVQVVDALTHEISWEYAAPYFYSSVEGVAQPLWNGNFMITSSRGGRSMEVTPAGDTVWQWESPVDPMRPIRYPDDHSPQLAKLKPPKPASRIRPVPFVDRSLFRFLNPGQVGRETDWEKGRKMDGWKGKLLTELPVCRLLLMPANPTIRLAYGLDADRLDGRRVEARFTVDIADPRTGRSARIHDEVVSSDQPELIREVSLSLVNWEFSQVDVCVGARPVGEANAVPPNESILWGEPVIESLSQSRPPVLPEPDEAEREWQELQLRTIGYIQ